MEPPAPLCHKCQLISSEFILSRDFRDYRGVSTARTAAASWTCHQNEQGKRYREIGYHDMGGLQEASRKGCKICSFYLGLLGRFSVNGHFPGLQGHFKVAVSETGGLELVPPSEWTWGDLNLGWQEMLSSNADQAVAARDGQMRTIARFCSERSEELRRMAIQVIRPWLQQCEAGHPCGCGGLKHLEHRRGHATLVSAEPDLPILPARVIDVGLGGKHLTRLHVSQPGERGRYLTLSYRWGEGNEAAMTTAHNIAARTEHIDVDDLPATIRDAIEVARAIGVAYIWIDAVCIVQATDGSDGNSPDPGDFKDEARKMSAYYGSSYCTIAAAAAENTAQGFLQPRTDDVFADSYTLPPWLLQGGQRRIVRVGPGLPRWKDDVQEAAMYKRAWILQERALSARVLHWGRGALWWECSHQRASEFLPLESISASFDQAQPYMQPERWLAEASSLSDLWRSWSDLIREYSAMNLGRESDRLIALRGLADAVSRRFPGEVYLFGLWRSHLPQALCWEAHKRRQVQGPSICCDAPSWSWAACPHHVMYMYAPTHPLAEVTGYDDSPESSIFQGRLRIRGLLERAPFKGRKLVREYDDGSRYRTKRYSLHFDSCPLECPQMSNVDLLLIATLDGEMSMRDPCATQFLLVEPVERFPSHYRRVGKAMRWTKSIDWKGKNSEEVDIYLV